MREPHQAPAEDYSVKAEPHTGADDPVQAMLYIAEQEMGMNVVWAVPDEAAEDWDDALEDLEDAWMRNPAREHALCHAALHSSTKATAAVLLPRVSCKSEHCPKPPPALPRDMATC